MVEHEFPDDLPRRTLEPAELPADWIRREVETQQLGDAWLDSVTEVLLMVPSVIVPIGSAPDRNMLINHRHRRAAEIKVVSTTPFTLDPRLFRVKE